MKLYRIQAVMLRHLLLTFRVFGNVINLFYWPVLNIFLWGFNSVWNASFQNQAFYLTLTLLTALTLWQVLFRLNMEVCLNLFDELQSNDFSSLFSTPLQLNEWMTAVIGLGIIKSVITFVFAFIIILLLYGVNILTIGWYWLLFLFLIAMIGWAVGFLAASGVVIWGRTVHELVWVCVWAFVPFSGIFYSISVLPKWAQIISFFIPHSYVFESLRFFIKSGELPYLFLLKGLILSFIYLILSLILFKFCFEKSRKTGLSRLENT